MALSPGSRIGPYEVTAAIGEGGMGQVYRARDSRLNRDVAIKILPDVFAGDPDRLARFTREAQTLAALNHSNVAQIYGLEGNALVMELVEGEDLSQRLARGAIPLDDALPIAGQIADGVEAAHRLGVVHRDLKPANIKLRADGTVKILDFGLAKLVSNDTAPGEAGVMNSPTFTSPATQMGVILGTAAYMAPEQAKGKPIDKRADIWAFGAVLFEMLAGVRPFQGETISETLASVLKEEPDWTRLPPDTPASIRRLLVRCLQKDPRHRLQDVGDARLELEDAAGPVSVVAAPAAPRRALLPLLAAAAAGIALTAVGVLLLLPILRPEPSRPVRRLSIVPPSGTDLFFDAAAHVLSPDGGAVVFRTADQPGIAGRLWLRPLSTGASRPLPGTEKAFLPFWSPDSREIAFFADGRLKRLSLESGAVTTICSASDGRGGTWATSGLIVFAPSNAGPLMKVSASGGEPSPATSLDSTKNEASHRFPWFLPGDKRFLFAALPGRDGKVDVAVGSIDSMDRTFILSATSGAMYATSGHLLFPRPDSIVAQVFDASTLTLSGEPIALGDASPAAGVAYSGSWPATVSRDGTMLYLASAPQNSRLAWADLRGEEIGTVSVPEGSWVALQVSPDGKKAIATREVSPVQHDLWVVDLERGGASPLTTDTGSNVGVTWSPDSTRIAYASNRAGPQNIYLRDVNGTSPEQLLFASPAMFKEPTGWSPDGRLLVFNQLDATTRRDLWVLPLEGDRVPKLYLATAADEHQASVSPDGRWLAYLSDETRQMEINVRAFATPGAAYRVTSTGAGAPIWAKGGRQLAYPSGQRAWVVDVLPGTEFRAGPPRSIATLTPRTLAGAPAPDLSRILLSIPLEASEPSLTVVLDWLSAMRRN